MTVKVLVPCIFLGFCVPRGTAFRTRIVGSLSRFVHVLIGDGEVWYSRGFDASSYLPWLCGSVTDLVGIVVAVPVCVSSIRDEPIGTDTRVNTWKTMLRYVSCGLIGSNDCVSHTRGVLQRAGVSSPRWIVTPDDLLGWLIEKGCPVVEVMGGPAVGDPPASQSGLRLDVPTTAASGE